MERIVGWEKSWRQPRERPAPDVSCVFAERGANKRLGGTERLTYLPLPPICGPKSNSSNRSLIAGLLSGTYGFSGNANGLGKLSRLRCVTGGKFQFRSMNLRMET